MSVPGRRLQTFDKHTAWSRRRALAVALREGRFPAGLPTAGDGRLQKTHNGGAGISAHGGGGGGGGRITIWRKVPIHEQGMLLDGQVVNRLLDRITDETKPLSGVEADLEVLGGTGWTEGAGEPGTVRFINGVYSGTLIRIR